MRVPVVAVQRVRCELLRFALMLGLGACSEAPPDAALLKQIASVPQLFWDFAYDPASNRFAVFADAGEPGFSIVDAGDASVRRVPPEGGGWPRGVALSPGGKWLAYHMRQSWDHRLYVAPADGSGPSHLVGAAVRGEELRGFAFSPSGERLVYELIRKDKERGNELRVVELASFSSRTIYADKGGLARGPGWSSDGNSIYYALGKCLEAVQLSDGQRRTVACLDAPISGRGVPNPPTLSPDGQSLALTVETGGCLRLVVVTLETGASRYVEPTACGMRPLWLPRQPGMLAYIGLDGAASRMPRVLDLSQARSRGLGPDLEVGVTSALGVDGAGRLLAVLATPRTLRSVWRFELDAPSGTAGVGDKRERLYSQSPPAIADELGRRATVPYQRHLVSSDGLRVPLLVFPPSERRADGRGPAILYLHGGDHGREDVSPIWWDLAQYFTASGMTVVAVNFRGSTGYGGELRELWNDDAGKVADIRAAAAYLAHLPWVDPDRIFVLAVSSARELAAQLLATGETHVRGGIQWFETAKPWLAIPAARRLPLLWVSGTEEENVGDFPGIARELASGGTEVKWVAVPGGHRAHRIDSRVLAAEAARRFVEAHR